MSVYLLNNFLLNSRMIGLCLINKIHISYPIRLISSLNNFNKNGLSSQNKRSPLIWLSEEINNDYIKYFKYKKDLMKSFRQGYIKRVRLRAPNNSKYIKIRDRKRN